MGNDNSIIVKSFCYNKIAFFGAMFDILVLMQILGTRQCIFICDNPAMPCSRINSSILSQSLLLLTFIWSLFTGLQNTQRSTELPGRPPVHPPLQSPPSKDINSGILNGGISRNPVPSFHLYPSESEVRKPHLNTAYSSIYSTNDQLGRRSPVRLHGSVLSTIPSASSFDDSLEVGGVSRLPRNEMRSTSSLGLRPAVANSSGDKLFYSPLI